MKKAGKYILQIAFFILTLSFTSNSYSQSADCTNMDFELGNLNFWNGCYGIYGNPCVIPGFSTGPNNAMGTTYRHIICSAGYDPSLGGTTLSRVLPDGGNYSLRLGNSDVNYESERITRSFLVDTTNENFEYSYAVVLEDPAHAKNVQPYFRINMFDGNGNIISCATYEVFAAAANSGFKRGPNLIQYHPWVTRNIPLNAYRGQVVTIEFTTADCDAGGHFGYAYIEADCNPFDLTTTATIACEGKVTTICAPKGGSVYNWNSGHTGRCIDVNKGGYYEVTLTTVTGCKYSIDTNILQMPSPVANFNFDTVCQFDENSFTDSSYSVNLGPPNPITTNQTVVDWDYKFNTQNDSSDLQNPKWTHLGPGTYNVTLTVTTDSGCKHDTMFTVPFIPYQEPQIDTLIKQCRYDSVVQLTASIAGGFWQAEEGLVDSVKGHWNPSLTTKDSIWLIYYLDTECNTPDTMYIKLADLTDASIIPQTDRCTETDTFRFATAESGGIWSGPSITNAATGLINPRKAGEGRHQYIYRINEYCSSSDTVEIEFFDAFGDVTGTDISCFGSCNGKLKVINHNGVSFSFDGGFNYTTVDSNSGYCKGTYTAIWTDSRGCSDTGSFELFQPTKLQTSSFGEQDWCRTGSGFVETSPTGGTPPYEYNWNTSDITSKVENLKFGTYSVTVTDSQGCVTNSGFTLIEVDTFIGSLSSLNVSCQGKADGSAWVTSVSGGTLAYSYKWSNNATTDSIFGLQPGTFIVTITDDKGCEVIDSVLITEPSAMSITLDAQNATCVGYTDGKAWVTTVGGTLPYTYEWNSNPIQTTDTAFNLGPGWITVVVSDDERCELTDSIEIGENSKLFTTMSKVNVICAFDKTGEVQVSATGGTGNYTYQWSSRPSDKSTTATGLDGGLYTVTVTDITGCLAIDTVSVYEPLQLLGNVSHINVSCYGEMDGSASSAPQGGNSGGYIYYWSTSPSSSTPSVQNLDIGSYFFKVEDTMGCADSATFTVTQPAELTVSTSSIDAICYGSATGELHAQASGGSGPGTYNYIWNTTPSSIGKDVTQVPAGNYTVNVTDANLCTVSGNAVISEPTDISLSTSTTDVKCHGGNDGTATVVASGSTPGYTYAWSTSPTQTTATATNLSSGNYTVTVLDANSCSKTTMVTVNEPTQLTVSTTSQDPTCFGYSNGYGVAIPSGGTGPYRYSWSIVPAQDKDSILNIPAGNYSVTVIDDNNCSANGAIFLNQPSDLTLTGSTTDVICFGENTGTATVNPSGSTPGYSYLWKTNPSQTTSTATNLFAGTYEVMVYDTNQCTDSLTLTVIEPDELFIQASSLDETCFGYADGSAEVSAIGGIPPYQYLWTPTNATTDKVSALAVGNYTIEVTDQNLCSKDTSVTVSGPTEIILQQSSVDATCFGFSDGEATISASGGVPGYNYQWSTGSTNTTINSLTSGNYTVTVFDITGCFQETTVFIDQPVDFEVDAGQDTTIIKRDSYIIDATTTPPDIYNYFWTPGATLIDHKVEDPTATPLIPTTYHVRATNAITGCEKWDSMHIDLIIIPFIYVPTVFTPNGDGKNDIFWIQQWDGARVIKLEVFNRWGEKVYSGRQGWDGTYYGVPQPIDTYVFQIHLENLPEGRNYRKGSVTLLR